MEKGLSAPPMDSASASDFFERTAVWEGRRRIILTLTSMAVLVPTLFAQQPVQTNVARDYSIRITKGLIYFATLDDDKDSDTNLSFYVHSNKQYGVLAKREGITWGNFSDGQISDLYFLDLTDANRTDFSVGWPASIELRTTAVGHDVWRFNVYVMLGLSNGCVLKKEFDNVELIDNGHISFDWSFEEVAPWPWQRQVTLRNDTDQRVEFFLRNDESDWIKMSLGAHATSPYERVHFIKLDREYVLAGGSYKLDRNSVSGQIGIWRLDP